MSNFVVIATATAAIIGALASAVRAYIAYRQYVERKKQQAESSTTVPSQ